MRSLRTLALAACLSLPGALHAQVIDFENSGVSAGGILFGVPTNGYFGFNWTYGPANGGVFAQPYANVTHAQSSGIVALFFNDWVKMSRATAFSVASVNLSSYQNSHQITVEGWLGGVQQYTTTITGSTTTAPLYTLNYNNIDEFRLSTDQATSFADDITLSTVPEPASLVLMASGLFAVGLVVRRRRA